MYLVLPDDFLLGVPCNLVANYVVHYTTTIAKI